jgi:hypothetical protein
VTAQVGTSKNHGGGDKGRTISLQVAVHLGHMLQALMTKKKKKYQGAEGSK